MRRSEREREGGRAGVNESVLSIWGKVLGKWWDGESFVLFLFFLDWQILLNQQRNIR